MPAEPHRFAYESMGTKWQVTIWDDISPADLGDIRASVLEQSQAFDQTYSRFKKTSLIWSLTEKRGIVRVPPDLVTMLRLYERLHDLSGGKCNPLVGFTLSDMGYDLEYSLRPKAHIRPVPDFHKALRIVDDEHLELHESVLIDLGALGKGFFVDTIAAFLLSKGLKRYLVDGSGDIYYHGNGESIRCGLEHPGDTSKVIGVLELREGALCASASNRRRWATYHHTIDPQSLTSPEGLIATWVKADTAALADGLATCLFLTEPERYAGTFAFEYCILNHRYNVKRSAGFMAELF